MSFINDLANYTTPGLVSNLFGGGGGGGGAPSTQDQSKVTNYGYQPFSREGNATQWAIQQFNRIFGRDPSQTELAQVLPSYVGVDPHITDVNGGNAVVANLFSQQENTPDKLYAKQQAEYLKNAPQHYGTVDQLFQQSLGRGASDAEKQHFGSLLASGGLDQYGLQSFISQLPDAVKKQDEEFRNSLRGELQNSDSKYYNEQILPSIQSNFSNAGRSYDASGFKNAALQAAGQQNQQRDNYLAQLSASQYGGRAAAAQGNYQDLYQRYYGLQDTGLNRQLQGMDQLTQRNYNLQDYSMQKQAYDQYLRQYGKRGNIAQGILGGGASGATAGAVAGPWGALAGGILGAGLGAYGQSQY